MSTSRAKPFSPFADDAASLTLGKLTVENGRDQVSLYGSLDVTRDQAGLRDALALKQVLDGIVAMLQADTALPERIAPPAAPKTVSNPFG